MKKKTLTILFRVNLFVLPLFSLPTIASDDEGDKKQQTIQFAQVWEDEISDEDNTGSLPIPPKFKPALPLKEVSVSPQAGGKQPLPQPSVQPKKRRLSKEAVAEKRSFSPPSLFRRSASSELPHFIKPSKKEESAKAAPPLRKKSTAEQEKRKKLKLSTNMAPLEKVSSFSREMSGIAMTPSPPLSRSQSQSPPAASQF